MEGVLLVRDSTAREVMTARPQTLASCRGNGIRHLSVLEGRWLAAAHEPGSRSDDAKRDAVTGMDSDVGYG